MITLLQENERPEPGKQYLLRERFDLCPDGICRADFLTESERREMANGEALYLTGVIQRADAENGNTRVYPYRILMREMTNYEKLIRENRAVGELDHPDDTVINLKNACHMVTKVWWEGKEVWGKLKILTNTPSGQILAGLIKDGVAIGLSSRGLGSVREGRNGILIVEDDFQLICFDVVSEPSTQGAFMHLMEAKMGSKELQLLKENRIFTKADKINRLLTDIVGV